MEQLGIKPRTAQDWMRLHRFEVKSATVAHLGGLRETYAELAKCGKGNEHLWPWIAWEAVLTASRKVIETTDSERELLEVMKRVRQIGQEVQAALDDAQHVTRSAAA